MIKTVNDIQISRNFNLSEFESHDTKEVMLHPELIEKLQDLRNAIGKPIIINSGYRTIEHNKAVGGAENSKHMQGKASDIRVDGMSIDYLEVEARAVQFYKVLIYHDLNFIHVEVE